MATAGEMSHLLGLTGTARERFAAALARREERPAVCEGCARDFVSTRPRERFCSPECCVAHFEAKRSAANPEPEPKPEPEPAVAEIRECKRCGASFKPVKPNQRFCGQKCRVYAFRTLKRAVTAG